MYTLTVFTRVHFFPVDSFILQTLCLSRGLFQIIEEIRRKSKKSPPRSAPIRYEILLNTMLHWKIGSTNPVE